MDTEQWQKVNSIVDTVLDLEPDQRQPFIQEQCGGDPALKTQVTDLLQSIEESQKTGFLEDTGAYPRHLVSDFVETEKVAQATSLPGQQIGRYKILELVGHGGMGSVYVAERADDAYNKHVALKVMRRGMDTPSNIKRFNRERHILATLDHPNIARLLDGGVTDDGLPYLVMEYVDGTPLLKYCNANRLTVKERLKLFKSICRAVQHAHTNAIIHRDLKPSNILVTEEENVKVLDFGIAKLLEPDDPKTALFQTRTGARLLTLGYAAPEQVQNAPITTATDTYTLGILLYELLCGSHAYELRTGDSNITEIERVIREETPVVPSRKFRSLPDRQQDEIAKQRSTSPGKLATALQGDLDAIIMKALRKEPEPRYPTPDQLLDDLQRRESNLPILAREDSLRYKTGKFLRRHKTGLSAAAGILLLLVGLFAFHTWRITDERNIARQEAQKAEAVTNFLTDLIQTNYPENAQGDTITVRQFLDQGFRKVQHMQGPPLVKGEIMNVMGHTYRMLGETEKAKRMISGSIDLLSTGDVAAIERANMHNVAGLIYRDLGKPDTAAMHLRQAVDNFKKAGQTETAEFAKALRDLAYVERLYLNNYEAAEEYITRAIAVDRRVNGPESAELAESYYIYASLLREQRRFSDALTYQNRSINILEQNIDGPHPGKSANYNNLALLYKRLDSTGQAIRFYRKSLQMNKELYGADHFRVANNATNIALQFMENGQLDSAMVYNKKAMQIGEQALSEGHQSKIRITLNQARILNRMGAYQKSDSLFRKALAIADVSENSDQPLRGNTYMSWAKNALDQHQEHAALNRFAKAFQLRKKNLGIEDSLTQLSLQKTLDLARKTGNKSKVDSLSQYLH